MSLPLVQDLVLVDTAAGEHLRGRQHALVVAGDMGLEQHRVEHDRHRHPVRLFPTGLVQDLTEPRRDILAVRMVRYLSGSSRQRIPYLADQTPTELVASSPARSTNAANSSTVPEIHPSAGSLGRPDGPRRPLEIISRLQ